MNTRHFTPRTLLLLCLVAVSLASRAHADVPDTLAQHVLFMLKSHSGKTICLSRAASASDIRQELLAEYPELISEAETKPESVARAMWTKYPCPFSPKRAELRWATASDIQGAWLFPESSQKYRFGPQVQARRTTPLTVKCEAIGYFEPNELRAALMTGHQACPFSTAADLAPARKNPVVSTWELREHGRLIVQRTDVFAHIEEWDTYIVTQDFSMYGTTFKVGELLQYLRRERGNEVNAATQFRHLQPLR